MISSLSSLELNTTTTIAFGQYNNITNNSTNDSYYGSGPVFPAYIRPTATVLCSLIMGIGVLGNVMVPIVIFKSKDMRNSTNVFLMNLSFADLMVLLVCTPTVLVEVNSRPETWVLGEEMCKAVPFIEMMVTHASVLTILAISFERYYAICEPLKAGYICTKTRAFFICLCAWLLAGLLTSPMLFIPKYGWAPYYDGSRVPVCLMPADTLWRELFFYLSSSLFFWVPLVVLLILYTVIAIHLMADPGIKGSETFSHRARSQLVLMLAAVVVSFFLCLMPFRVLLLWYLSASDEMIKSLGIEKYFNILYFCRIITYVHSAINPILYNLMSSKFRDGFMRVCGIRTGRLLLRRHRRWGFTNSLNTTTTSLSYSSTRRERDHFGSAHYHYRDSSDLRGNFRESRTLSRRDFMTSPRNSKTPDDISPILIYLSRKNTTKSNVSDGSSTKTTQENKNEKESYESLIGHDPQPKRISSSCSESLRLSQYGDLSDNSNSQDGDPEETRNSVALSEYDNVDKSNANFLELFPDRITCRISKSNSDDDILKIKTKKNPPDRGKGSPEGSHDSLVPITKINENEVPGFREVSFSSCKPPQTRSNSIRRSILKSRINQRLTNDCNVDDEPCQVLNGSVNKSKENLKNSEIIKCTQNVMKKCHPESHV